VRRAVCVVVALVISSPAVAGAEDKDKARELIASGDKHLSRGDKFMERGKKAEAQESFLAALADYNAAFAAFNSPKIYFAIALAEKRLGRYIQALHHFEQLLEELEEVPENLRNEVERHVNEVKQNLGVIFFRVEPDGAAIAIDGELIGTSPLNRPHYVVPGEHEYTITKDGYRTLSDNVEVEAGDVAEDKLALQRLEQTITDTDTESPLPDRPVEARPPSDTQLYVGLGVTGGLAIGATITGLLALSKHNTFEDDTADPATRDDAQSSGKTLALVTDAMIIGALAAGTYTAFYYFTVYKKGKSGADEKASVSVIPAVTPTAAGLAIGGRF
jgi:tetratricopeptide (TPR) repeat protein